MPDEAAYQVFNYVADCFIHVPVVGRAGGEDDTCERVCRAVCEQLKIKPVVFALVGLRLHDEKWFLAGGSRPSTDKKYDFRLRFKVSFFVTCVNPCVRSTEVIGVLSFLF
uniref:Uncharacterized protein n=1 Tax=Anopheles melas TaxID=34690 RepID=A0A182TVF4_9DIPT